MRRHPAQRVSKRRAGSAWAWVALLGLGCGAETAVTAGPSPPAAPAPALQVAAKTATVAEPVATTAPPRPATPAPTPVVGEASLPAPKPTTISLASDAGDPVDRLLTQGDQAFEAGDYAAAAKAYEAARAAAPRRAGPAVGVARVRIARQNLAMDFASAKGNREVVAAVNDLRRAAGLEPGFGAGQVELGRALLLVGDAPTAIDALRRGVQLLPTDA